MEGEKAGFESFIQKPFLKNTSLSTTSHLILTKKVLTRVDSSLLISILKETKKFGTTIIMTNMKRAFSILTLLLILAILSLAIFQLPER